MVLLNFFSLLFLSIIFLFYQYIYPKKKIKLGILLFFLSLLPLLSILRKGTYESGAFSDYVKFSMSFYESLKEGNLVPQWDSLRCAGYGCPQFIFMYTLPYYIISFFHFIGFSFISSIKLLLALAFLSSGLSIYTFVKDWLGKLSAFVAAIFYLFSPYHLVDLHFRTDIAEILSFVFLPIQFLSTKKILETRSWKWIIIGAVNILFLIMSHQAISLATIPLILTYGIVIWIYSKKRNQSSLLLFLGSLALGLLLSMFYWLPILSEAKNIYWGIFGNISFIKPWSAFFYSPWKLGFLFQGPYGELSFIVGYTHWIIVAISIYMLAKNKIRGSLKIVLLFLLASFAIAFFMMQEISESIWITIPIINKFQFSYRFLLFLSFLSALMAAILSKAIKNKWIITLLCFFTITTTILNWGHRRTIPSIDDSYLRRELITASPVFEVTIPKWADYKNLETKKRPAKHIEVLSGKAKILEIYRNTTKHEYVIYAQTKITLRENTFYFPGWNLIINNRFYPFSYETSKHQGLITFSLPKGNHKAILEYSNNPIISLSQKVSLLTLFSIIFFSVYYFLKHERRIVM